VSADSGQKGTIAPGFLAELDCFDDGADDYGFVFLVEVLDGFEGGASVWPGPRLSAWCVCSGDGGWNRARLVPARWGESVWTFPVSNRLIGTDRSSVLSFSSTSRLAS
jgi:hypothetical protein